MHPSTEEVGQDHCEFRSSLNYLASSSAAWATEEDPEKTRNKNTGERKGSKDWRKKRNREGKTEVETISLVQKSKG